MSYLRSENNVALNECIVSGDSESTIICGSENGCAYIFDHIANRSINSFSHSSSILSLATHGSELYCGLENGEVITWDLRNNKKPLHWTSNWQRSDASILKLIIDDSLGLWAASSML